MSAQCAQWNLQIAQSAVCRVHGAASVLHWSGYYIRSRRLNPEMLFTLLPLEFEFFLSGQIPQIPACLYNSSPT